MLRQGGSNIMTWACISLIMAFDQFCELMPAAGVVEYSILWKTQDYYIWYKALKEGQEVNDLSHLGRPSKSKTDENIDQVKRKS